jgi:hypothetical protein
MAPTRWQVPLNVPLRLRYGRAQEFTVRCRCVRQNDIGITIKPDDEVQTFSEYRAVMLFVPYGAMIEVEVLSAAEGEQERARVLRGQERRDLVERELKDLLESGGNSSAGEPSPR